MNSELPSKFLQAWTLSIIQATRNRRLKLDFTSDPYIQRNKPLNYPPRPIPQPILMPQIPRQANQVRPSLQPSILSNTQPIARPSLPIAPQPAFQQPFSSLQKLIPILNDPFTRSLECPGPGKPIMVSKQGIVQATSIFLTQEEITSIIKEISQKTRIPLLPGIFKAAFGAHIITAVISEFVGSRFIIERKH